MSFLVGNRVDGAVRVTNKSSGVPSSHDAVTRDRHFLHCLVLRVRSHKHKGVEGSVQGTPVVASGGSFLWIRYSVLVTMGRYLCVIVL